MNLIRRLALMLLLLPLSSVASASSQREARALTLEYLHDLDCGFAARAAFPESEQRFEARLAERVAPEKQAEARRERQQALKRRSRDCAGLNHIVSANSVMWDPVSQAKIKKAAAMGDPAAIVMVDGSSMTQPELRALLSQIIDSGDGLAVAQVGLMLGARNDLQALGMTREEIGLGDGWRLLACDLGMDCGRGSRVLDLQCLKSGGCGHPDLGSALREAYREDLFEKMIRSRDALIERIRIFGSVGVLTDDTQTH